MKKILSLVFFFFITAGPSLAWGWGGEGDCPFTKDQEKQENTEKVEESEK